jgi:hypothetical protein
MKQNERRNHSGSTLLALSAAALAIPGIVSSVHAAAPAAEAELAYKASAYREADIDRSKLAAGSATRYDIDTHQLRFVSPLGRASDVAVDLSYETMSGASPWFIMPGTNGPVQVMSGASIEEERKDIQASVAHYFSTQSSAKVLLGFSTENDYRAVNVGLEASHEIPERELTLSAGFGYSDDEIEPTDPQMPDRIDSATRDSTTAYIGVAQVLSARTVVQGSISIVSNQGYLSDPYKKVWRDDLSNTVADSRPNARLQTVLGARLRHFVPNLNGALHLDYRFFDDDWDISSHTVDLAWYQNLPHDWQLTPSLRYYSQSQAYFYGPFFYSGRSDGFASSDYRLSPYGAVSFRLRLERNWGQFSTNLEWESYRAAASLALNDVQLENPGLVEFDILSFGLQLHL